MTDETWQDVYNEPEPTYRKEFPVAGRTWLLEGEQIPQNETAALMEAAPHAPERESWEEIQTRLERTVKWLENIVEDNNFTEEEMGVLDCCVFAGHSIRTAAEILNLPKSTVHRLLTSVLNIIRKELENGDHTLGITLD